MSWIDPMRSMCCPKRGGQCTVKETRPSTVIDNAIRRRRECLECGHRFSTLETIIDRTPKKVEEVWKI